MPMDGLPASDLEPPALSPSRSTNRFSSQANSPRKACDDLGGTPARSAVCSALLRCNWDIYPSTQTFKYRRVSQLPKQSPNSPKKPLQSPSYVANLIDINARTPVRNQTLVLKGVVDPRPLIA